MDSAREGDANCHMLSTGEILQNESGQERVHIHWEDVEEEMPTQQAPGGLWEAPWGEK